MDKEKKKEIKKLKKKAKTIYIYVSAALLFLLAVSVFLYFKLKPKDGTFSTISKASLEKLIEISDLSTLDYTYNAITTVYEEDGTTPKYYVSYDGTVTAGIDMEELDVSTDDEAKTISISLPEVTIQNVSIDMSSLDFIFEEEKYETETVSQEAYKACLNDLNKKASEEDSLLSIARENAIEAMDALISPWVKQLDSNYTVEIK